MTFPSLARRLSGSAAPDSRRRCPTAGRRGPTVSRCWRTAFRDGRIAALTPTDQPTSGLWDGGSLALPGRWNPMPIWTRHSPLNAAVRRRPDCWRRSTPCTRIADTGPGRYSTSGVRRAGPGGSEWRDPFAQPCRLVYRRRAGRRQGDRPPRYRRHHRSGWRWSRCPCFASRRKRGHRPDGRQQRRALPAGRLHPLLQLGRHRHGKSAVQRGPLGSGSGFAY